MLGCKPPQRASQLQETVQGKFILFYKMRIFNESGVSSYYSTDYHKVIFFLSDAENADLLCKS